VNRARSQATQRSMAERVPAWQRAFDARPRRERLLMIAAAVAVIGLGGDVLWLNPAWHQWSATRQREAQAADALHRLQASRAEDTAQAAAANARLRDDIEQLRRRVAEGEMALRDASATLVPAHEMVPLLERVLARAGGLKLRAMQSLGRTPVSAAAPAGTPAPAAAANDAAALKPATGTLYRHEIELSVEGSYADLLAYLKAIEQSPQRVIWAGMTFEVTQHPDVKLTLRLATLSPDREWLEI
jgi:MSHA biogenesis protein MshJ